MPRIGNYEHCTKNIVMAQGLIHRNMPVVA